MNFISLRLNFLEPVRDIRRSPDSRALLPVRDWLGLTCSGVSLQLVAAYE